MSYNKIGDVQVEQGDLAAALKSYGDGLAIAERLAKSDPGNARWQLDLGIVRKVGDVQLAQGDLAVALESYQDKHGHRRRLAQSDPSNADWQRDLEVSYSRSWQRAEGAGRSCRRAQVLPRRPRHQPSGWRKPIPATPNGRAT